MTDKPYLFNIYLSEDELVLLDGKCRLEIQEQIDKIKSISKGLPVELGAGLTDRQHKFVAGAVEVAKKSGILEYRTVSMYKCDICEATRTYQKYKSTTRKHKKGDPNYDKPINVSGVTVDGIGYDSKKVRLNSCCNSCFYKLKSIILEAIKDIACEIPRIMSGVDPEYKYTKKIACPNCQWIGIAAELKNKPGYGSGQFHGTNCPKCNHYDGWNNGMIKIGGAAIIECATGTIVREIDED